MKIKDSLLKSIENNSLIIATGKQEGIFYFVYAGNIYKRKHIFVPTPVYSDREGQFQKISRGGDKIQGGVYENKKHYIRSKFTKKVSASLKKEVKEHGIKAIYLFCPMYIKKDLISVLPGNLADKIVYTFNGNYNNEHEFYFLEKIKEKNKKKRSVSPHSREAVKLLKKKKGI